MKKIENSEILLNKIRKLTSKKLNLLSVLKLFNIFIEIGEEKNLEYVKIFIRECCLLQEDMPEDFYELVLKKINTDYLSLFNILLERNIYSLISYLKHNQEDISDLKDSITPLQYYLIPKRHINKIIDMLKNLEVTLNNGYLNELLKDEPIWLLKRIPHLDETEYKIIAYKMYVSIGLDNTLELLSKKYGEIDYEKIHYLFSNLNIKVGINPIEQEIFNNFLFSNKKDFNNVICQMLNGGFNELFLNFAYFYNNFTYFISKLGSKLSRIKLSTLLEEKYLAKNLSNPEITGDILEDMLSSYYHKYDVLNTPKQEIHKKNFAIYNEFLRRKYKSSIPMIKFENKNSYLCEVLSLNDPRNLVLGYRSGSCFRINGDASILFHNFLQSDHIRLLSISTLENKDFAMMLIMRNGNVLIGQGIEVSNWAKDSIKGKKLYDVCKEVLKEMMDYMNSNGDEIVATIIGRTNSNVSNYNNQILPFLVNPILKNSNNYYNGIDNYQCLLDLSDGKSINDIKLYTPIARYFDEREKVLRRERFNYDNYMEIEKRLISLRFFRMQSNHSFEFYQKLTNAKELYTCCNKDWYITLFEDGTIDSFVLDGDERAKIEYDVELENIKQHYFKLNRKKLK